MNRLRIVVEEAGGVYEVKYIGRDAGLAQQALSTPTPNKRALFVYPHPVQFNRRLVGEAPIETGGTPVLPITRAPETPAEDVPIDQGGVDEAAELVGGATESPAEAEVEKPKAKKARAKK